MIATISGEISQIFEEQVVINIGNIGLLLYLPEDLRMGCRVGMRKTFHTHLVVREDNLSLYGFETVEARDIFLHLISVPGIGPKLGIATLSALDPDTIRRAITAEQPEIFNRVSGIGKKTAQKIILHLQGQIRPLEPLEAAVTIDEIDTEVIEALTALGYSIVEAQTALQSLEKDETMDAETRLRKALQYFV